MPCVTFTVLCGIQKSVLCSCVTWDVLWAQLLLLGNYSYSSTRHSKFYKTISPQVLLFPQFSSVQSLSCVQLFATPWTAACQASLSITNSPSLLKLMSIQSVMPSNHLILCCTLLLLPSIFPRIRVFSNVLHIRWPKYWSFSFSSSPSKEYSGLISFRIDWFDLLAVQGTLKSLLQHHSSKASILWCSAFFMVQLTSIYDYWKNHSFDQMDICQQGACLYFVICCLDLAQLFFQEASIF